MNRPYDELWFCSKMQNAQCKMQVFAPQMIKIVAFGDTFTLHFAF